MIVLNLLPPAEKKELKIDYVRRSAIFYGLLSLFLLGLFTALLFPSYLTLKLQIDVLEKQIGLEKSTVESKQAKELEERIREINKNLSAISEFSKSMETLAPLFEFLAKIAPENVYFTEVSRRSAAGKITLRGFAKTRDDVLALKYALETGAYFKEVESPVSNYLKESEIDFVFFASDAKTAAAKTK